MLDTILVAPGAAHDAAALKTVPRLELRGGQLQIIEPGADGGADVLAQPVDLVEPVAALGLVLVRAGQELYVLPLAGLRL